MLLLLITAILMIVVGLLAAASLIAAKQPNAQAAIDKLVPFQGIIGIIAALWGLWGVIQSLIHINISLSWVIGLIGALVLLALGFILGYALISKYTMKTPEAAAKGEALRLKLVSIQTPLGLVAIGLGVWLLILAIRVAAA